MDEPFTRLRSIALMYFWVIPARRRSISYMSS